MNEVLALSSSTPLIPGNGGVFIAAGTGSHPDRTLDSFELILVRTGTLQLWEEDQRFSLAPGDALLLWPFRNHRAAAPYDPDTSFYWVHFFAEPRSHEKEDSGAAVFIPQHAHLANSLRLVELFHRFLSDQENVAVPAHYSSALLRLMLYEIALQQTPPFQENPARNLALSAHLFISKRHREPLNTSRIASKLNCNPNYLERVYKQTFGITVTDGIHAMRMRHAKSLLLMTALSVKEIATACGYEDPDYFRRIFRRNAEMKPTEYRSLHLRLHTNSA